LSGAGIRGWFAERTGRFRDSDHRRIAILVLPIRAMQRRVALGGAVGIQERRAFMRRLYVFTVLFVTAAGLVAIAVELVYWLISVMLGQSGPEMDDITRSIAFLLITAGVWLYHWAVVRDTGRRCSRRSGLYGKPAGAARGGS